MKQTFAFALLVRFAVPVFAAQNAKAAAKGFRAEFAHDLDDVQKKIIDLATAVPADKYSRRPAEGVRSISEVYTHIAGGNYFLATFLGVKWAALPLIAAGCRGRGRRRHAPTDARHHGAPATGRSSSTSAAAAPPKCDARMSPS